MENSIFYCYKRGKDELIRAGVFPNAERSIEDGGKSKAKKSGGLEARAPNWSASSCIHLVRVWDAVEHRRRQSPMSSNMKDADLQKM